MAKTKKASARRAHAKKSREHEAIEGHEAIEDEEAREDDEEQREDAPAEAHPKAEVERSVAASAGPSRSAPRWAGLVPGIIVVGLIVLAIVVQLFVD